MAEETFLSDDFLRQLINVGEVDIVVGLPTHNDARTIEPMLRTIQAGLLKCFPRERAAIINADGGSHDGTPDLVASASIDDIWRASKVYALRTLHAISTQYARTPEPGAALRTILAAADLLRAKVCVLISPDSTTIEPDWVQRLARPVYDGSFDLVCPIYQRQTSEGALMRNLLYPLTRSMYGHQIREPYASEFAVSGRLATDFLSRELWNEESSKAGVEIALTVAAITGNYQVCQTYLGTKTPATRTDVVAAMRRTVAALFSSLDTTFPLWSSIKGSTPVPTLGNPPNVAFDPSRVNRKRLQELFTTGVAQLESVLSSIVSPHTLSELQKMAAVSIDDFQFPDEVWVKTVFEFTASYHKSSINRDHIVQALVPLYRGRSLAFLLENRNGAGETIEKREESLCAEFERLKPYLLEIWTDGK